SVIRSENNMIYTILEYNSIYSTIPSQEAPTEAPKYTRTMFQIKVPNVVSRRNIPKCIFDIPAGMEIKLRIKGINRQKKTVQYPYLPNQTSAFCISFVVIRRICPHL